MPAFRVTLTRPAYEYAEVTIHASTASAAETAALSAADDLDWQTGDRQPDAPTVVATEPDLDADDEEGATDATP